MERKTENNKKVDLELLEVCPCCGRPIPPNKREEVTIRWKCFAEAYKEAQKQGRRKKWSFDNL
jgi:RNA polymerase-binding transcription factor DksA